MSDSPKIIADIVSFHIIERQSKKGNNYKAIYGKDTKGVLHFVCYVK